MPSIFLDQCIYCITQRVIWLLLIINQYNSKWGFWPFYDLMPITHGSYISPKLKINRDYIWRTRGTKHVHIWLSTFQRMVSIKVLEHLGKCTILLKENKTETLKVGFTNQVNHYVSCISILNSTKRMFMCIDE